LPIDAALAADGALERGFGATLFALGADAFNGGWFWEAHECWEALWRREARGTARRGMLQGLILLAAARVKRLQGRPAGAGRLHRRALALLDAAAADQDLREAFGLTRLLRGARAGGVTGPAPVIAPCRSPRSR
jgi:hypothetical protein